MALFGNQDSQLPRKVWAEHQRRKRNHASGKFRVFCTRFDSEFTGCFLSWSFHLGQDDNSCKGKDLAQYRGRQFFSSRRTIFHKGRREKLMKTHFKNSIATVLSVCFVAVGTTQLSADVVWDEDIDGSLSTDRFNTTNFGTLAVGSNNMVADTQSGISKFFTFTIAEGEELSAIILDE